MSMVNQTNDGDKRPVIKREFIVERDGRSFVLYAGLLDAAHEDGLSAITTQLVQPPTPDNGQMAICRAEVITSRGCFTGYGDASPSNVTTPMRVHLLRMAETRAKARALRDAVNVGVAAFEELGDDDGDEPQANSQPHRSRRTAATPKATPADRNAPPSRTEQDERLLLVAERRGRPLVELQAWAAEHFHARSWAALTTANRDTVLGLLEQADAPVGAGVA